MDENYRALSEMLVWNGEAYVVNPFVSRAQERACYARDDPNWDCSEWSAATPKGKQLPERKGSKKRAKAKRVANRARRMRVIANLKKPRRRRAAIPNTGPTRSWRSTLPAPVGCAGPSAPACGECSVGSRGTSSSWSASRMC